MLAPRYWSVLSRFLTTLGQTTTLPCLKLSNRKGVDAGYGTSRVGAMSSSA